MPFKKFLGSNVPVPRVGDLTAGALAELSKSSFLLFPIVKVAFPNTVTTQTLSPNATTFREPDHDTFGGTGAADIHSGIDDPVLTPDDDTSYIGTSGPNDTRMESRVSFPALAVEAVDVIELRIYCRAKSELDIRGAWAFGLRTGGSNFYRDGGTDEDSFFNLDYRTICYSYSVNPDTGLAWTRAEVDAIEGLIISMPYALGTGTAGTRHTQMWIEIDHTEVGAIGQYSVVDFNSESEGLYESLITQISDVEINVMSPNNALQGQTFSMTIADADRRFSDFLAERRDLTGSEVEVRWCMPDLPVSDWFTTFKGVLKDVNGAGATSWKMDFKTKDAAIVDGSVVRDKITEQDFKDAPDPKVYDNFSPVCYGRHDSTTLTDDGAIELIRVGDVAFLSALGRIKQHLNVYTFESGDPEVVALLVKDTDWAEDFPIINGRQYSRVTLIGASVATNKEKTIRADVEGYEEVGDGTGLLLRNPVVQLLHFLANFVFNTYQSGLWFGTTGLPIDDGRFDDLQAFFDLTSAEGSRYLGGKGSAQNVKQELQRFTKGWECKMWWNHDGEFSVGVNDPFTLDVYPDEPEIEEGVHDVKQAKYFTDSKKLLREVAVQYQHQQATNKFLTSITVADLSFDEGVAADDNIQHLWSVAANPPAS